MPWCPDCARCLAAACARVAEVRGTLLEVQVRLQTLMLTLKPYTCAERAIFLRGWHSEQVCAGHACEQVGPRPVWKDPGHPLRHHPALRLTGIPTLVRWHAGDGGSPGARLGSELEAATSEAAADALIQEFVAATWHGSRDAAAAKAVDVEALIQQLSNGSLAVAEAK